MGKPGHVGIIMDGNGRWAVQRGFPRNRGHLEGLKAIKIVVQEILQIKIPYLSLYVFSTENWSRTQDEIQFLMDLIVRYLRTEYKFYCDHRIRIVYSGELQTLPLSVQREIKSAEERTASFSDGMTVNLLINYGGQAEIIRAVQRIVNKGFIPTVGLISSYLDQPQIPPLDLVIRTAGEQRLSNFMIWQASYAEYYFTKKLWPDFSREDLLDALEVYSKRVRKFGGNV